MAETVQDVEARNEAIVEASFDAWHAGTGNPYDLLRERCDLDHRRSFLGLEDL